MHKIIVITNIHVSFTYPCRMISPYNLLGILRSWNLWNGLIPVFDLRLRRFLTLKQIRIGILSWHQMFSKSVLSSNYQCRSFELPKFCVGFKPSRTRRLSYPALWRPKAKEKSCCQMGGGVRENHGSWEIFRFLKIQSSSSSHIPVDFGEVNIVVGLP